MSQPFRTGAGKLGTRDQVGRHGGCGRACHWQGARLRRALRFSERTLFNH